MHQHNYLCHADKIQCFEVKSVGSADERRVATRKIITRTTFCKDCLVAWVAALCCMAAGLSPETRKNIGCSEDSMIRINAVGVL